MSDDSKKGKGRLRDRLVGLSVGDAAELLVRNRHRIRESPVEHAKAAADVTRALAEARSELPTASFDVMRRAVLLVARRDWAAAAILADALIDLVRAHPDSVDWVGEAVARAVQADRTLARQLARVLPECATRVAERGPRLRIVTALADLCRRHPGLGLAALPTVRALLTEGTPEGLASFLEEALQRAARSESVARSFLLRESRTGRQAWDDRREGLALVEVARVLQLYAEAHLGTGVQVRSIADLPEDLPVPEGAIAVSDGQQIFLTPRIDRFDDDERNFRLYKVATALEVGRAEFGTFGLDPAAVPGIDPIELCAEPGADRPEGSNPVLEFSSRFPESSLARRLFLFAEDIRVDACLRREYPGLARDLDEMAEADRHRRPHLDDLVGSELMVEVLARWLWFGEELPEGPAFRRFREASLLLQALRHPGAGVQDSAGAAGLLYGLVGGMGQPGEITEAAEGGELVAVASGRPGAAEGAEPGAGSEQGGLVIEGPVMAAREGADGPPSPGERIFSGDVIRNVSAAEGQELLRRAEAIQQALDARGMSVSLREILAALDVDPRVSDRTLERNLLESFRESLRRGAGDETDAVGQGADGEVAAVRVSRYPEWDEQIGDYRPEWCSVWERRASGNASAFVEAVMGEHGPMLRRLRQQFQMLRPEGLGRERRAREGDELDLDALVEDLVDQRVGLPSDGRVYVRRHLKLRDVAVAFLVDQSASTRELVGSSGKSVIEVEKESLVLMSEALEALGDRYAIFGFSGRGRQMVTFDVFKDFDEKLGDPVRGRIGAMSYRMENRDGAAIRHATRRLLAIDARTRLLILLSDGKPLDCGCDLYQASYAQSDTRMALREALERKVHPFCITVDPAGEDYLRDMYGDVRYAVIDSVAALPERLPAIYRRLTT